CDFSNAASAIVLLFFAMANIGLRLIPCPTVSVWAVHGIGTVPDLAVLYRNQGLTVVETVLFVPPLRLAPWAPFTCVEAVKRILGIHVRAIITPWQLYKVLSGQRKVSFPHFILARAWPACCREKDLVPIQCGK
ncbi:MAG: hypothetical protein FD149_2342, partial [Rhodospirillaceae bacterium]